MTNSFAGTSSFSGNLLGSIQKKIFPNGINHDVMKRLDQLTPYTTAPSAGDSFKAAKAVQTQAFTFYKAYGFENNEKLLNSCNEVGYKVKVDSKETKYIADPEETGCVSVYTFTDKYGNQVSINNINAREHIDNERVAFDNSLSDLIAEINTGSITLPNLEEQAA